jgi:hypothetical protein
MKMVWWEYYYDEVTRKLVLKLYGIAGKEIICPWVNFITELESSKCLPEK